MKKYLIRALFILIHVVTLGRLRYSRPTEGNALTMSLGDKFWWAYKFFGHPIREPEKDKRIREYFRAHPIAGFAEKPLEPESSEPPDSPVSQPNNNQPSGSQPNNNQPSGSQPIDQVTITFAGDILPAQFMRADTTMHFWDDVSEFFLNADFRCANLESPVVTSLPLSCPTDDITTPPHMNNTADAVGLFTHEGAGVNVFSTANNHSLDQGVEGLLATLDFLDQTGLPHVGTARNALERDAFLVLQAGGVKVAFLSWTFSLNSQSLPEGQEYLANVVRLNVPDIDIDPLVQQVRQARRQKADVVVAFLHWGLEHEAFPLAHQMETAHRIIEAGVDIIAGNHPHAPQPAERYCYRDATGKQRDGLILYALGDLLTPFPQVGLSALGALVRVQLIRLPSSQVVIRAAELKPVFAYRYPGAKKDPVDVRVLDFITLKQRLEAGDLESDPVLGAPQVKALRKLIPVQEDVLPVIP